MKAALDLPVLLLLTVWSWLSPPTALPPLSQLPPAGCDGCVAAGRTLRNFTAADLGLPPGHAPVPKEP